MVHLADLKTSGMEQNNRDASVPPPRLVKAAHEFEAQLMKELMAPLTRGTSIPGVGGGEAGDEEDAESGSGGALGEFAAEALGQALSAAGGFGIAHRILGEIGPASVHKSNQGAQSR
jgi:hypothetical protein